MKFRRTGETRYEDGHRVEEFELELRAGHTIHRTDFTNRLSAGRKGRAAEVSLHRELRCTCGGEVGMGGLSVAEDLAHLRHFESAEELAAFKTELEDIRAGILRSLGL